MAIIVIFYFWMIRLIFNCYRRIDMIEELEKMAGLSIPKDLSSEEANQYLKDVCLKCEIKCPPPETTSRLLDKVISFFSLPFPYYYLLFLNYSFVWKMILPCQNGSNFKGARFPVIFRVILIVLLNFWFKTRTRVRMLDAKYKSTSFLCYDWENELFMNCRMGDRTFV